MSRRNVSGHEVGRLLVPAVRYAIGRSTYIVGDACDWVRTYWTIIEQQERDCIRRDVAEALADGRRLGWQCDHDEWAALAAWMHERVGGGT